MNWRHNSDNKNLVPVASELFRLPQGVCLHNKPGAKEVKGALFIQQMLVTLFLSDLAP